MRPVKTTDHIEQAGFPRSIRPDDGQNLPSPDFQIHAIQGVKLSEIQGEILHAQQSVVSPFFPRKDPGVLLFNAFAEQR